MFPLRFREHSKLIELCERIWIDMKHAGTDSCGELTETHTKVPSHILAHECLAALETQREP